MSQQNLDDANVHASLQQVCGEAMAKRVRSKSVIEAALASRFDERISCGGVGQRRGDSPAGEQPALAAMRLPDLSQHVQHHLRQRESPFFVAFADHVQQQGLGVHRGDRERDRFSDPQSVGVNERETAAINGLFQRGNQTPTIVIGADVGEPDVAGLAYFFLVNSGHW